MIEAARSCAVPQVVFLPGASGAGDFWLPVADRLPSGWKKRRLSWPGAGDQPHDPLVRGFEDLVALSGSRLDDQSDLIAQSMGGVVAIGIALRRPEKVRRLVLVATSGGIDVAGLGGADWREAYRTEYPNAASWVWQDQLDYTGVVPEISAPTLLLWGDSDPLGEREGPASGLAVACRGRLWGVRGDEIGSFAEGSWRRGHVPARLLAFGFR